MAELDRISPTELSILKVLWETEPVGIESDSVRLRTPQGETTIPNDLVSIFAGGVLPTVFLTDCGVQIDVKFGRP